MITHPSSRKLVSVGLGLAVFAGLLLLVTCRPRIESSRGVQLLLTTPSLSSKTEYELRFDVDMVGQDQVGQIAAMSPLRIEPMLKGRFRWTSPCSGIYTPTEAPRLATEYRFRLTSGLMDAAGRESSASLQRILHMPGLEISNIRGNYHSTNSIPAVPILKVAFNADVDTNELTKVARFVNGDASVPAIVSHVSVGRLKGSRIGDSRSQRSPDIPATWQADFAAVENTNHTEHAMNAVQFKPGEVLTPGDNWKLVIDAASVGGVSILEPIEIAIGPVRAMAVSYMDPANSVSLGKRILVHLTRPFDGAVPDEKLLSHFTITPRPENLGVRRGYKMLTLSGDFQVGVNYDVQMHPGLRSAYGLNMHEPFRTNLQFEAVRPHLRFPSFSSSMAASGAGRLKFLSINSGYANIRAKRLGPETLIHALRGFDSVYQPRYDEHREIPFDLVPGRSLPKFQVSGKYPLDRAVQNELNLAKMTRGKKAPLFIEARPARNSKAAGTQTIVQFTDLGMLWKRHAQGLLVHVFSLATGEPIPGATVFELTDDNEILQQESTDQRGIVRLREHSAGKWLMAQNEEDIHALRLDRHSLSRYGKGYRVAWRRFMEPQVKVLLFSDRPVYREGDTVRFKLLARRLGDSVEFVSQAQAKRGVRFDISDRRGDTIFSTNATLSASGSLDFSVQLPRRPLGKYFVSARGQGISGHHDFLMADYEPDAFEIELGGQASHRSGEPIDVPVKARYLMGKELTSAKVRWSFDSRERRFEAAGFDDFEFCPSVYDHRLVAMPRDASSTGKGEYSAGTNFVARARGGVTNISFFPRSVAFQVNVTDLNQQTINASRSFTVNSSEFYLGVRNPGRWLTVGEQFAPAIVAINADGQPCTEPVDIEVRLDRVEWHSVRVRQAGGAISYRNEPQRRNLRTFKTRSLLPVREGTGWSVSGGIPVQTLAETGRYLVEVRATDQNGGEVRTSFAFDVTGPQKVAWNYRNSTRVELIPDRSSYFAGETAKIIVKTPLAGPALVAVERDEIHYSYTTNLTGNAPVVEVPIASVDAPNTFVSVTLLRGTEDSPHEYPEPEFRYGFCQLQVRNPEADLRVDLMTSKPSYRPGETVAIQCEVLDQLGRPVRNAEVTLYAVDEGVLNLTGYNSPDPLSYFNEERPLSVSTHLSLPHLLPENPANLSFQNKGFIAGGGGKLAMKQRSNFEPCPLWEPTLKTDQQGRVTASFAAPDSLTRFRVIAVVHKDADRFGNDEMKFEVNKPLMVEPVLPRFARRGDRIKARALIINNSTNAGEVEVTWQRRGKVCTAGPGKVSKRTSIFAKGATTIVFPIEFTETGEANWTWTARLLGADAAHRDSVVSELVVAERLPLLSSVRVGPVHGTTNLLAGIDPMLLHGRGKVTVRLSHSPFLQLWGGINYLLRYPYGCAEQTSSSLLPWLIVSSDGAFRELLGKTDAQINEAIARGVDRLLSMQTRDGGLAYWPGRSRSEAFPSAYGGMMLALAKQQGIAVPEDRLKQLANHLRRLLLQRPPRTVPAYDEQHGMALYTLALLDGQLAGYCDMIHAQRGGLSAQTRLLTALALLHGDRTANDLRMARELAADLKPMGTNESTYFGSRVRRLALELMVHDDLGDPEADTLRDKLMQQRKRGHWYTTQNNAWSLLALSRMSEPVQAKKGSARISWGRDAREQVLSRKALGFEEFELSAARAGEPLQLRLTDSRRMFAHVRVDSFVEESFKPVRNRGFSIERSYYELDENGKPIAPDNLEVGDTVLISLRLKVDEDAVYVAVDDPLPAVLESSNSEFKSRRSTVDAQLGWSWFSDHSELRSDRTLFFRDRLPKGEFEIRYLARVRAEGEVTAAPTRVEEMYEPDRYGLSESNELKATY